MGVFPMHAVISDARPSTLGGGATAEATFLSALTTTEVLAGL
jgi:hypothetical protein